MNHEPAAEPGSDSVSLIGIIVRTIISLLLLGAGVACIFLAIKFGRRPSRQDRAELANQTVEVVQVKQHAGGVDFKIDGIVIPFRRIDVPAEVNGRVSYKSPDCRVGHTVKQAEVLLRIDPQNYQLEVRRLEEDVKQARANLHELDVETNARTRQIELAREDLAIKQREVKRYEDIQDPGVYSKSELDAARLKELQARDAVQTEQDQLALLQARYDRMKSAIDLGIAKLEKAQLDLKRTEITAPIDGVITSEGPEQGGYLPIGGTVTTLQDTSRMEIRCSLHMRQMSWLWQSPPSADPSVGKKNAYQLPETPATVIFHVEDTEYQWDGKLAYYDGAQVDEQTRMVPCRVIVENPLAVTIEGKKSPTAASAPITLMAGMYVTVVVHATPPVSLLEIPEIAVQPGNYIWTVHRDEAADKDQGNLRRCEIRVAQASPNCILAYARNSDLHQGDLVIISPLASPTPDAVVEIMEKQ